MRICQSCQGALGVIDLINALMCQQYGFVIWTKEYSREWTLPKRYCTSLNLKTFIDAGINLSTRRGRSVRE
jgi:hypothetical protein